MLSSVGLDLVDVREVAESIERFGQRYLERCYTPAEVAYAMSAPDRVTGVRRLAARWAAKEATIKALGASERGISPRQIEVVRAGDGSVHLELHGPAFAAARAAGVLPGALVVSMSHQGDLAAAVVVAQKEKSASRIRWKR
jgi:holo-[acyl-carrier protein] synthase